MKIYLFSFVFLVSLFSVSCTNKRNNNAKEKEVFFEHPVVLDSLTIMHFSADSLIKRNGNPASDVKFLMKETTRDKDILREFFPYDSDKEIRELKWDIDSENYLLIWYIKEGDNWKPFTFSFRSIYEEY